MAGPRLAAAVVAAFAAYLVARALGVAGLGVVYLDVIMGSLAISALVAYASYPRGSWLLVRGVEGALTAGVMVVAVQAAAGAMVGFAVNGLLAGHVRPGVLLWRLGVLAASSLAAHLLRGVAGVAAAAVLQAGSVLSVFELPALWPPDLARLAPFLLNLLVGAAVGVVVLDYGVLVGFVYGVSVYFLPVYLLPLLPRLPALALTMLYVALIAVTAVYMRAIRLQPLMARAGSVPLRGLLALLVLVLAMTALMKKGFYVAVVVTGSMEPSIHPGDLVVIAPAEPEDLVPGDVVAYIGEDGSLVVHRLVAVTREGGRLVLMTKGDANPATDPPFTEERLVGKIVARVPYLGLPHLYLARLTGSVLAFPVSLAALAASVLVLRAWGPSIRD